MALPSGWYPRNPDDVRNTIDQWRRGETVGSVFETIDSVIVPHAGWFFSGRLAWKTIAAADSAVETVIIAGGHLQRGSPCMMYMEDGFETPLGIVAADIDFREKIKTGLNGTSAVKEDYSADNTVEVQLPFVKLCFPNASVVCLRTGAGPEAAALGKICAEIARAERQNALFIGSTDLTHYGPSYGFTGAGRGETAYRWVRDVNDQEIIGAMVEMDTQKLLELAAEHRSACSAGAAAAAIAFAATFGCDQGEKAGYSNSYLTSPGESFVGYAGLRYGR